MVSLWFELSIDGFRRLNKEDMTAYHIAEPAVEETLERLFYVGDRYFEMDNPTYGVTPRGDGDERLLLKKGFKRLVEELKPLGHIPRLRRIFGRPYISVMKRTPPPPQRYGRNLILLAATAGTVFVDGFIRSSNPILTQVLMPGTPAVFNALLFALAILGVFGLHELGHKAVTLLEGVDASMPYFIPAPPGMGGTFGAVITQKDPPTNRDALFDLGISGPLVGFLVTVLVTVVGLRLSFVVPVDDVLAWMATFPEVRFQSIPLPMLIEYLASLLRTTPEGMVMVFHPVAFAAWVGCIVTFINLIPAWQLDGGHISRALLGKENHKIMSLAGIILMLLSGYFIMAVMIVFFMMRSGGESAGPLDDISPLSLSRKLFTLVYFAMVALTLVALFPF